MTLKSLETRKGCCRNNIRGHCAWCGPLLNKVPVDSVFISGPQSMHRWQRGPIKAIDLQGQAQEVFLPCLMFPSSGWEQLPLPLFISKFTQQWPLVASQWLTPRQKAGCCYRNVGKPGQGWRTRSFRGSQWQPRLALGMLLTSTSHRQTGIAKREQWVSSLCTLCPRAKMVPSKRK